MKKIIARPIAPEYQSSPLYAFDAWDFIDDQNVIISGNDRLCEHYPALYNAFAAYFDEAYDVMCGGWEGYTLTSYLNEYLKPLHKDSYSTKDVARWKQILNGYSDDLENVAQAFELLTGNKYVVSTIRGCCQGDWQQVVHPVSFNVKALEIEYFDLGSEWEVDGCCYYVYACWDTNEIKSELADATGYCADEIELHVFDSWSRIANYKIA